MESAKNRIGLTKLSLALALKHPALILELKGIPDDRKTFWTGRNISPWTSYIVSYQDHDKGRSQSKVGRRMLREGSEKEVVAQSHGGLV